ncbi:MAG: MarR family transcriptional regulator [Microthrixaceae bacterium]
MTMPSDPRLLVMHGLRLKGFADVAAVSDTVGVPKPEASAHLQQLVDDQLAVHRDGRLSGFTLTSAGRVAHARLLSDELDAHDVRAPVKAAYARFLGLNVKLLEVCTAWQLRDVDGESTLNDHTDPAYDDAVISELGALHDLVSPICEDLAASLARYGHYGPRLAHAVSRVRAGDGEWFAKPMIDSYHTVWFELHEDLLATLGIERGAEVAV